MKDQLIRIITKSGNFKATFVSYLDIMKEVQERHKTSPLATVALSRFVGASLLLSTMLKEKEQYSFHINCSGSLQGLHSDVNSQGTIRAYIKNPFSHEVDSKGKLDIKSGLKTGTLSAIKWIHNQREPYSSKVNLEYGSIAQDFTYYLTTSEQIPSAISLGEYIEKDGNIVCAGGILVQAMPGATDTEIGFIETTISMHPLMSEMLLEGYEPKDILEKTFGIMEYEILTTSKPEFKCNCSQGKAESIIISLGSSTLEEMISSGETTEVKCEYCSKEYPFTTESLKKLYDEAIKK